MNFACCVGRSETDRRGRLRGVPLVLFNSHPFHETGRKKKLLHASAFILRTCTHTDLYHRVRGRMADLAKDSSASPGLEQRLMSSSCTYIPRFNVNLYMHGTCFSVRSVSRNVQIYNPSSPLPSQHTQVRLRVYSRCKIDVALAIRTISRLFLIRQKYETMFG